MKRKKRIKPAAPVEYRLLIAPKYKEREKQFVAAVELQTAQEFSNFRYEIVVQDTVDGNSLRLNIRGLHTPQPIMPAVGPAVFRREYSGLFGTTEIIVSKIDGQENMFLVDISKKDVVLKKAPEEKFVELVV